MNKGKGKNDGLKVYRPTGLNSLNPIPFVIGLTIFPSVFIWEYGWLWICLLIPVATFVGWISFIQARRTCIVLSKDGIEYRFGQMRTFASWDNLSHFGVKHSGRGSSRKGFFLHESLRKHLLGVEYSQDFFDVSNVINVPTQWEGFIKGTVVDLEKFAKTEFGQDLLHYAPHLFEKEKAQ